MTRLHADQIDVERGMVDGGDHRIEGPVRFRWGRRSYAVHAVLDHWVEAGSWWKQVGRTVGGIDDGEREVWRVEVQQRFAGRDAPVGVVDVNFDWSAGRWFLVRVHD